MAKHRVYSTSVASVYPHDVAKSERNGRNKAEIEEIEEPTMQETRNLDKLVDELARGKAMEKNLRSDRDSEDSCR